MGLCNGGMACAKPINASDAAHIQAVGALIAVNVSMVRNVRREVGAILSHSAFWRCRIGCEQGIAIPLCVQSSVHPTWETSYETNRIGFD
jgi:hypothetical protein